MRYLSLSEVLQLHLQIHHQSGGDMGVLDWSALESAIAQPRMTFSGEDLYPGLIEKAGALGFAIIANHPFLDGNKRTGHGAIELFLLLNDFELIAPVDEQERAILQVAAGTMDRPSFTEWLRNHVSERRKP